MRIYVTLLAAGLAACTSNVTVPDNSVIYEVPYSGTASTAGGVDPFTSTIESALAEGDASGGDLVAAGPAALPAGPLPAQGTPLDDDRLNLMEYTLQQQRIDAAIAERELAEARSQLVVVPPSTLPNRVDGVNIALYAQQTSNRVGERVYPRRGVGLGTACGRYGSADDAQRAFLAAGGPQSDSLGLDPDGDGFACRWDPAPYRQLRL